MMKKNTPNPAPPMAASSDVVQKLSTDAKAAPARGHVAVDRDELLAALRSRPMTSQINKDIYNGTNRAGAGTVYVVREQLLHAMGADEASQNDDTT